MFFFCFPIVTQVVMDGKDARPSFEELVHLQFEDVLRHMQAFWHFLKLYLPGCVLNAVCRELLVDRLMFLKLFLESGLKYVVELSN